MLLPCAQIVGSLIQNVTIADAAPLDPGNGSPIIDTAALVGDLQASGAFTHPTPVGPKYQIICLTTLQFITRFNTAEQPTIVNSTDPQLRPFVPKAAGACKVDPDNDGVVMGRIYLDSIELIASTRDAALLTGSPPS